MNEDRRKSLSIFIVIALACGATWAIIPLDIISGKITVYSVSCNQYPTDVNKCEDNLKTEKKTYLPMAERQEVVALAARAFRYEDCSVMDRRNWSCFALGNHEIGMEDGSFRDNYWQVQDDKTGEVVKTHVRQISKAEYFFRNLSP